MASSASPDRSIEALTVARLFDSPPLAGPPISTVRISPDGKRIAYLRGRDSDKDRLDLWAFDVASKRTVKLADAAALGARDETLSEEEQNRRERQRTAALAGIVEYAFAPSGKSLLIPHAGRLFHLQLEPPGAGLGVPSIATELSPSPEPATDASFSPCGGCIAFVRGQNLKVYNFERDETQGLTSDGGGAVKNGMAEFVAQEEMDRSTGYWWSPDGRRIAFARVDESGVAMRQRVAIAEADIVSFAQRYPVAGEANAEVRLGVAALDGGQTIWMDLGAQRDIYLARVNWHPDGRTLVIQRQSRDQRRLDLLFGDAESGRTWLVLSEHSESWIELHHEITFLKGSSEFIWASSRDGHRHLYLHDLEGRQLRRLTAGEWNVDDFRSRAIKRVDERTRQVYFSATERSPTQRHLYRVSLDTGDPHVVERISRGDGIHAVCVSADASFYADLFTANGQPPMLTAHGMDGAPAAVIIDNVLDARHPYAPYLAQHSSAEFGSLSAADGQTLYYRLFKPAGFDAHRRYPAIVDVYGGPGVQRVLDQWTGASFTQILTRAGYVVFQLDNRGSAHRGVRFQAPIKGKLGEIETLDQVEGARFLATRSFVDPDRIGVWGWSYGGYMTLMLLLNAPGIFRAGIAGAPVTDWALYDTHYTERYLGLPQHNPRGYAASGVLPYAAALPTPLLLMHGMADDNVLFSHSIKLMRTLQESGKLFDVMVYPGAKHGLLRQREGRHAYAAILSFFDRHLAPRI